MVGGYSHVVSELIHILSLSVEHSPSETVTQRLLPMEELVLAKEKGGLERAIGAALLNQTNAGNFNIDTFIQYLSFKAEEGAFLEEYYQFASDEQEALFERVVSGPAVDQVEEWRKILIELPKTNDTQGVNGGEWFATATERLNLIKQVEDAIGADAITVAQAEYDEVQRELFILLVFDVVVLVIVVAVGWIGGERIARPLSRMSALMGTLASGNLEIDVPYRERSDEVGDIAKAVEVFRQSGLETERLKEQRDRTRQEAEEGRVTPQDGR